MSDYNVKFNKDKYNDAKKTINNIQKNVVDNLEKYNKEITNTLNNLESHYPVGYKQTIYTSEVSRPIVASKLRNKWDNINTRALIVRNIAEDIDKGQLETYNGIAFVLHAAHGTLNINDQKSIQNKNDLNSIYIKFQTNYLTTNTNGNSIISKIYNTFIEKIINNFAEKGYSVWNISSLFAITSIIQNTHKTSADGLKEAIINKPDTQKSDYDFNNISAGEKSKTDNQKASDTTTTNTYNESSTSSNTSVNTTTPTSTTNEQTTTKANDIPTNSNQNNTSNTTNTSRDIEILKDESSKQNNTNINTKENTINNKPDTTSKIDITKTNSTDKTITDNNKDNTTNIKDESKATDNTTNIKDESKVTDNKDTSKDISNDSNKTILTTDKTNTTENKQDDITSKTTTPEATRKTTLVNVKNENITPENKTTVEQPSNEVNQTPQPVVKEEPQIIQGTPVETTKEPAPSQQVNETPQVQQQPKQNVEKPIQQPINNQYNNLNQNTNNETYKATQNGAEIVDNSNSSKPINNKEQIPVGDIETTPTHQDTTDTTNKDTDTTSSAKKPSITKIPTTPTKSQSTTNTSSTTNSSGSGVKKIIPIVAGASAATAAGLGTKTYLDHKNNNVQYQDIKTDSYPDDNLEIDYNEEKQEYLDNDDYGYSNNNDEPWPEEKYNAMSNAEKKETYNAIDNLEELPE